MNRKVETKLQKKCVKNSKKESPNWNKNDKYMPRKVQKNDHIVSVCVFE